MRVAHLHLDRGVPEQLLHHLHRRPTHHEVRSERVPKDVPADLTEPCLAAGAPERMLDLVLLPHPPRGVAEHERPPKVPLGLERRDRLVTEWDVPPLPALRLGHEATRDRTPYAKQTRDEIDVLSSERE